MFNWFFNKKNFEYAVNVVLVHEGLYSNDSKDPGGPTNYGVSLKFLRAAGIDGNMRKSKHITIQDIKSLNPLKAKNIYYKYFWIKFNIYKINSLIISTSLLDMCVLIGPHAIKLIQNSINDLSFKKINVDGIIGNETLNSINHLDSNKLNNDFKTECEAYFKLISLKNPNFKIFLDGWLNRVNSL